MRGHLLSRWPERVRLHLLITPEMADALDNWSAHCDPNGTRQDAIRAILAKHLKVETP